MEFSDSDKSKLATIKTEVEQFQREGSIKSKVESAIENNKLDFRPIDPEKAKEVITALFKNRLAQNKDFSSNVDPKSVADPNFFESH